MIVNIGQGDICESRRMSQGEGPANDANSKEPEDRECALARIIAK